MKNILNFQINHALRRTLKLSAVLVLAGGLAACSAQGGPSHPANSATSVEGGIDGSGGNIVGSSFAEFEQAVSRQKYFLRDNLHRLRIAVERGETEFWVLSPTPLHEKLIKMLIGDDPTALNAQILATEFYAQDGACRGSDSTETDAAVVNGKICFSYQAFRKFSKWELPRQLAYMSLHEFGHIRGLNEREASALQRAAAASPISGLGKYILVGSATYQMFFEGSLVLAAQDFNQTVRAYAGAEVEFRKKNLCESAHGAYARFSQAVTVGGLALPNHLVRLAYDTFIDSLRKLHWDCERMTPAEHFESLVLITKQLEGFFKAIFRYESPICESGICDHIRAGAAYPGDIQQLLQVNAHWLRAGKEAPGYAAFQIGCSLENLETGMALPTENYEDRPFWSVRSRTSQTHSLHLEPTSLSGTDAPTAQISVYDRDRWIALAVDGFGTDSAKSLQGYLQKGVRDSITADIAEIEPNERFKPSEVDPTYFTIDEIPQLKAKYRATCFSL